MRYSQIAQKESFSERDFDSGADEISIVLENDYKIISKEITLTDPLPLSIETEDDHFFFLLAFCVEGFLKISQDFDPNIQEIQAGTHSLIITQNAKFKFEPASDYANFRYLVVDGLFLERHLPEEHFLLDLLNPKTSINLQFNTNTQMMAILQELKTFEDHSYHNSILAQAKYLELMGLQLVLHENQLAQQPLPSSDIAKMDLVKQMISENIDKTFTIAELAKLAGTNQQYLKSNFKIAYGTTIAKYTLLCKMNHSKRLLLADKMTIGDIAQVVGYKHATHFTNAFKKFFGLLPKTLKGRLDLIAIAAIEMISINLSLTETII